MPSSDTDGQACNLRYPFKLYIQSTMAYPFCQHLLSFSLIKNKDITSNKDITLQDIDLVDHLVKTTVHNTNTVSVIVACTFNPIPIDMLYLSNYQAV